MNSHRYAIVRVALCALALAAAGARPTQAEEFGQLRSAAAPHRLVVSSTQASFLFRAGNKVMRVHPPAPEMAALRLQRARYFQMSPTRRAILVITQIRELFGGFTDAVIRYNYSPGHSLVTTDELTGKTQGFPWYEAVAEEGLMDRRGGYWFPFTVFEVNRLNFLALTRSKHLCQSIERAAHAGVLMGAYRCVSAAGLPGYHDSHGLYAIQYGELAITSVNKSLDRSEARMAEPISHAKCRRDAAAVAQDTEEALQSPEFLQHDVIRQCWSELQKAFSSRSLGVPAIPPAPRRSYEPEFYYGALK